MRASFARDFLTLEAGGGYCEFCGTGVVDGRYIQSPCSDAALLRGAGGMSPSIVRFHQSYTNSNLRSIFSTRTTTLTHAPIMAATMTRMVRIFPRLIVGSNFNAMPFYHN